MVSNLPINLAHYGLSNEIEAYRLDGKQQFYISILACIRFQALNTQLKNVGLSSCAYFGAIGNALLIYKIASPILKFIQDNVEVLNFQAFDLSAVLKSVDSGVDKLLDHANVILNVACGVSYVAMIVFGHTLVGGCGVAALLVMCIKRYGHMPAIVEKILTPLEILSTLYTSFTATQFIAFKILNIIFSSSSLVSYLMDIESLKNHLPSFLTIKNAGEHKIKINRSLEANIQREENVCALVQRPDLFRLNYSAFHAKEVAQITPPEDLAALEQVSFKDLFADIESKCLQLNITIKNQTGWDRIKKSLVNDRFTDQRPPNYEKFCIVFKAMLISLKNNEDNFESNIQEIAEIGNNCAEGWLREIKFMLEPKSNNLQWSVHHELAILRGELIKEKLRVVMPGSFEESFGLERVGGTNNIHLTNQVQATLWHRWRSFEGELHYNVEGRGLIQRLAHHFLPNTPLEQVGYTEIAFMFLQMKLPLPIPVNQILEPINDAVQKEYTIERLVEVIFDAVKPEYQLSETLGAYESFRKIEWQTCQNWLGRLYERNPDLVMGTDGEFLSDWVARDECGQRYLTKEGVRLLLWDMGIIETIEPFMEL